MAGGSAYLEGTPCRAGVVGTGLGDVPSSMCDGGTDWRRLSRAGWDMRWEGGVTTQAGGAEAAGAVRRTWGGSGRKDEQGVCGYSREN